MKASMKGLMPEWYELEDEKDQPEPVGFFLKPLNGFGKSEISMMSLAARSGERNAEVDAGSDVINRAFELGVKNWRNIEDADNPGQPLPFSRTAMERMKPEWIIEVGARILEISEMGVTERKN